MKKNKILLTIMAIFFIAAIAYAAIPRMMTVFPNGIWVGDQADTATYADGKDDGYFAGDLEVGGTIYSTTERSFNLTLTEAYLDGTGIIGNDGTTAPGVGETDNIPAIVWASSAEQVKCQWTFKVPSDYSSGLGFRILMSSSGATSTGQSIDWQLWVNDTSTTFDAAAIAQDAVSPTIATLDASNEMITLAIDATGESALSIGSYITVDIWNAGTTNNTTEIKGVQAFYTSTR